MELVLISASCVLLGLLLLVLLPSTAELSQYSQLRKCAVHKWILIDEKGQLPADSDKERQLGATLICDVCGKMPTRVSGEEL